MIPIIKLIRPITFTVGETYLFAKHYSESEAMLVQFLQYDPCPAIMIVRAPDGQVFRCLRDDLFTPEVNDQSLLDLGFSDPPRKEKGCRRKDSLLPLDFP